MNYADIKYFDVVNGLGVRVSIFVSGCSHHCEDCFNKETWNPKFGNEFSDKIQEQILNYIQKFDKTIKGISVLGGDATYVSNIEPTREFIEKFKSRFPKKDVWIWSGYTFEQIVEDERMLSLIELCDVLVDGKFQKENKNLKLKFRGSENQRLVDVKKSLISKSFVEFKV